MGPAAPGVAPRRPGPVLERAAPGGGGQRRQAPRVRRGADSRRRLLAAQDHARGGRAGEGIRPAGRGPRRGALRQRAVRGVRREPARPRGDRGQRRYSGEEVAPAIPPTTWLKPPSTYRISPVTAAARSESRNAAALPTSSVVTLRRNGECSSTNLRILPNPEMPAAASVLIGPAEMPFTRMPCGPRLAAR